MPRSLMASLALLLMLGLLTPASADSAQVVADPDVACAAYPCDLAIESFDGVEILVTIHKPAEASAAVPVPMILEGHGWGLSRQSGAGAFAEYLAAGFGVLSIDQRGHGESGGEANVFAPEIEGQDLLAIADVVTAIDWVARDLDADGQPIADDPQMGAIGGSYGGGYQYALALLETALHGETRLDALAPEITWHDLNDSLAPSDVPRSTWQTGLVGLSTAGAITKPYGYGNDPADYIQEAYVYGAATNTYPDGDDSPLPNEPDIKGAFRTHSPHGYLNYYEEIAENLSAVMGSEVVIDGPVQLDVPVFMGQATNDNLFNLNQAWNNFHDTLTEEARAQSTLLTYDFGHSLPTVAPLGDFSHLAGLGGGCATAPLNGQMVYGDIPTFSSLTVEFFTAVFNGDDPRILDGNAYAFSAYEADPSGDGAGECLLVDDDGITTVRQTVPNIDPVGLFGPSHGSFSMAPTSIHLPIDGTEGLTVAGIPRLQGVVYGAGLDQIVFVGLSRGHSPATAQLIQHNVLPVTYEGPFSTGGLPLDMDLAGVTAILGDGEQLFLTVTGYSDQFFATGSRTPGGILLTNLKIDLPVIE